MKVIIIQIYSNGNDVIEIMLANLKDIIQL